MAALESQGISGHRVKISQLETGRTPKIEGEGEFR